MIPCRNEALRLQQPEFTEFLQQHRTYRLVFVDDASRDRTADVIDQIKAANPEQVDRVSLPVHLGKGAAVRAGMLHVLASPSETVGYWDADLAAPLSEAERLNSALLADQTLVAVIATREPAAGRNIDRTPFRRHTGRIYAVLGAKAIGQRLKDPQCGHKIFRNGPALQLALSSPFRTRWAFDLELLQRIADVENGSQDAILEVPLMAWRDVPDSTLRPLDPFRILIELAAIAALRATGRL